MRVITFNVSWFTPYTAVPNFTAKCKLKVCHVRFNPFQWPPILHRFSPFHLVPNSRCPLYCETGNPCQVIKISRVSQKNETWVLAGTSVLPTTPTLRRVRPSLSAAQCVSRSIRRVLPKQAAPLDLSKTWLEALILLFLFFPFWLRGNHTRESGSHEENNHHKKANNLTSNICSQTHKLSSAQSRVTSLSGLIVYVGGSNQFGTTPHKLFNLLRPPWNFNANDSAAL